MVFFLFFGVRDLIGSDERNLLQIIEELENRLTEAGSMDEIIALVKEGLSSSANEQDESSVAVFPPLSAVAAVGTTKSEDEDAIGENDEEYDFDQYIDGGDEVMVADNEAGGFEGDLEMGDDEG